MNTVIGSAIGVFIGYGIYSFLDFKHYPELYVMQSAPWYVRLIPWGAAAIGIMTIAAVIKWMIHRKIH